MPLPSIENDGAKRFHHSSLVIRNSSFVQLGCGQKGHRAYRRIRESECGLRPIGAIGAYPPACKPMAYKPTGWKRPLREVGKKCLRKSEIGKAMEPGSKLTKKISFLNAMRSAPCPLPYAFSFRLPHSAFRLPISALCFLIPHSHRGVGAGPYGPEAAFPLPNSNFCPLTSVFCPLTSSEKGN